MAAVKIERSTVVFGGIFFLTGLFVFSLFQKQVLEHNQYAAAAQSQSTSDIAQPAQRGAIEAQDKDGNLYTLALSDWRYNLLISPREVTNKQRLTDTIVQIVPTLNKDDLLKQIDNSKVYVPPVATGLDEATAQKIEKANLTGVFVTPTLVREYPNGATIAPQVIGFLGSDGVGKYGVEATHDQDLSGAAGAETEKVDSLGRLINILTSQKSQPGKDVVLTLDYNLQYEVERQLSSAIKTYRADSGSVIVMDAHTGAIYADAGDPNFDPNKISQLTGADLYKLLDPNASSTYEPGSVVKPITMAIALDTGAVKPEDKHNAGGSVVIDGYTIKNALNKDYGLETMSQIIQNSDNVQMSWISTLLTGDNQYNYLKKFGFGSLTDVDLVGEQAGDLPAKNSWNAILRATAAFGQGISTTTLQLATDYAVFANSGISVHPYLVNYTIDQNGNKQLTNPQSGKPVVSTKTAGEITQMLVDTVNLGEGKKAGVPGMQVAGKTGTAQVPGPNGGYDPTKSIGSFAGFFPASNPKFVMVVRLNNPKTVNFAESSAAPTFGAIATWMTNYYGLK